MMRRVDPRVKLLWLILSTSGALFFTRPLWLLGLFCFSALAALLLGVSPEKLWQRTGMLWPLLLPICLMQIFFVRSGSPLLTLGPLTLVFSGGLLQACIIINRVFIILCGAAIMAEDNQRRVIASLTKMGVPYLFSFLLLIALRFIPLFTGAFSEALVAIQLRGVELENLKLRQRFHLYSNLALPVVADGIGKAQELAMAMEARGFGAMKKRSSYLDPRMTLLDWFLLLILFGLGGAAWVTYYFL